VKLLADECCDGMVVAGLRADGHDIVYVQESAPGSEDASVLLSAYTQQRVLLTEDKDFGESSSGKGYEHLASSSFEFLSRIRRSNWLASARHYATMRTGSRIRLS